MSPIPPYVPAGGSGGPIVADDFMSGRQIFSGAGTIDQTASEVVLVIGGGFNLTLPEGSLEASGTDAGLRFFIVNKGGSDVTLVLDDPPNEQINGVVGGTYTVPAGETHLVVQYTHGSWEAIDIDSEPAGDVPVYDHFQSASYWTGSGVLAAGEIAAGQQGNVQYLTPNGAASWSNGVNNPSATDAALIAVEVHLPAISVTPPVDGTLFSVQRTAILSFDGETDVYAYTARNVQHDTAKGAFYVPKAILKIHRAVGAGFAGSAVINDDLTAWWEDSGGTLDLPIFAQGERGHGFVSGRIAA